MSGDGSGRNRTTQGLARHVLVPFIFTFMAARALVFLIAAKRMPDVYLQVGETHVHHLNYGIFLLAGVGAYLLFARPVARSIDRAAEVYGVGLALTFDEFGLWLHLGGSYWQRASFDAVVVIAALLALVVVMPELRPFRPRHWAAAVVLAIAVAAFAVMLVDSFKYADRLLERMQTIERGRAPPP